MAFEKQASFCSVFRNDFCLDSKERRLRWIDGDTDPMRIWIAENFNARKVVHKPLRLLTYQRLTDMKNMRVTVYEQGRLVIAFHFGGDGIENVVEAARL